MSENKGDLISRKDLRKQINNCEYFHSSFQKMTVAEFLTIVHDLIDNAPTVEAYTEEDMCNATSNGYDIGYEIARRLFERPHIIDNCDMNVFEPEKYMKGGAE